MRAILVSAFLVLLAVAAVLILFNPERRVVEPLVEAVPEITLYHYFSGALSGGINDMVGTVNEAGQGVRLSAHALDHEAFKSMIQATLAQGKPPELFTYWAGARTEALVDQNRLEPFDDIWEAAGLSARFPEPIATAAGVYQGHTYLVPITQHLVVFFYNRAIFSRQGILPPATWAEFLALCRTLKERGITSIALGARERWPAQFWFDYLLLRTAGPAYRASLMRGAASYTDEEVRTAYGLWADLLENGYFNSNANDMDWAEATELVCRGEAAMTLMGTWAIQHFTGASCGLKEQEDFDYFIFPVIDETVPSASVGPIDGIVLARSSANRALAKAILPRFADAEAQRIMSLGSGALAPSTQVPPDFYSPFKQRLFREIEKTTSWAFNYDLATPPEVAEKGMDSFTELIAYPDQYPAILDNLETEVRALFKTGAAPAP